MSSNESAAYQIMRSLDVDYVLIIFGGVIGYSGDDINKFLWMVRIAEGEHPRDIRVSVCGLGVCACCNNCPVSVTTLVSLNAGQLAKHPQCIWCHQGSWGPCCTPPAN